MPPSALRKGKYDTSDSKLNSLKFDLSEIHDIYGYNTTLYDVLSVKRNASANDIKVAYLNKGREILLSSETSDVSSRSRKQFQAVSLAYEILCKDDLRALYDGRCSIARSNSVQWSKVVQEKVIKDAHPDEHLHRRRSSYSDDEACYGLEDELEDVMYYCDQQGRQTFIQLGELQGFVDSLNTAVQAKRLHLLEAAQNSKSESERQPSEEVATREVDHERQPPAEEDDFSIIDAHDQGCNSVFEAAEDTIFPVKGYGSHEVNELVETDEATADKANDEETTTTNKPSHTTKTLKSMSIRNKKSKPSSEDKNSSVKPETLALGAVAAASVATAAVISAGDDADATDDSTSAFCFTCGGASEALASDADDVVEEKVASNKTSSLALGTVAAASVATAAVVSVDDAADANDDSTSAFCFTCGGASEALANDADDGTEKEVASDKTSPSMKLRKVMPSRKKSKSLLDATEDEKSDIVDEGIDTSANTGWFCCTPEPFIDDQVADQPAYGTAATPPATSPWRTATSADGDIYYYNSLTNETSWKKPPVMTHIDPTTTNFSRPAADNTDKKYEEEAAITDATTEGSSEGAAEITATKKKNLRKKLNPMAIRKKSNKDDNTTVTPEAAAATAAATSVGCFICCASEAFDNDDDGGKAVESVSQATEITEKKVTNVKPVENTNTATLEEKDGAVEESDGIAEGGIARGSKKSPTRTLRLTSLRSKSSKEKKTSGKADTAIQAQLLEEEDSPRFSFFDCCSAEAAETESEDRKRDHKNSCKESVDTSSTYTDYSDTDSIASSGEGHFFSCCFLDSIFSNNCTSDLDTECNSDALGEDTKRKKKMKSLKLKKMSFIKR